MRLVMLTHGLLALYLATLLAVPRAQTPLAALVCLLCLLAGIRRRSHGDAAGLPGTHGALRVPGTPGMTGPSDVSGAPGASSAPGASVPSGTFGTSVPSSTSRPPMLHAVGQRLRQNWIMAVPLAGYGMLFGLQILLGWVGPRDLDQVLICVLSLIVLVSTLPGRGPDVLRWVLPGAALGAVGALGVACWQYVVLDIPRPYGHLGTGPLGSGAIKFSDLSALLAVFSLPLMMRSPARGLRLLGGVGVLAGLGATVLSQGRGALLGVAFAVAVYALLVVLQRRRAGQEVTRAAVDVIPPLLPRPASHAGAPVSVHAGEPAGRHSGTPAGVYPRVPAGVHAGVPVGIHSRALHSGTSAKDHAPLADDAGALPIQVPASRRWTKAVLSLLVGTLMLTGGMKFVGARFAEIGPQMERFHAGDYDSEVSQRLALWSIALRAGLHAPLTGVGFSGFIAETQRQRESGELPAHAIVYYASPHNEYLAGFSAAGIPGLLVVVMLFWGPLWVGSRRFLRGQRPEESLMLVLLSASYAVFTLTDSLLDRQISLLAYMLLASWLMSASRDPLTFGPMPPSRFRVWLRSLTEGPAPRRWLPQTLL